MRNQTLLFVILLVNALPVDGVTADVILELIGPSELSVEQGFPHSPEQPFPVDGESLLVSALIRNDNTDPFEAVLSGQLVATMGNTGLFIELSARFWDASADPDDPFIITPGGHFAITLEPHEVFSLPLLEIWGVRIGGTPRFSPAEIGSHITVVEVTIKMLNGLDGDPWVEPPDTFLTVDRMFTVTVVPEPTALLFLGAAAISALKRRRFH